MQINTALVSLSDKTKIEELASFLKEENIRCISTGGTRKKLEELGISVVPIEEITGNPESFDGRMKSISFQIGSGILFDRKNPDHIKQKDELGIEAIDLVVCNLYPFEKVALETKDEMKRIENIDIGGPSMIRAAAKNFDSVVVLTNPSDYSDFVKGYQTDNLDRAARKSYALKAFDLCAAYDRFIVESFLQEQDTHMPEPVLGESKKLRYGENSHQKASFKHLKMHPQNNLFKAKQLAGKELSYNNYLDMDAAWKSAFEVVEVTKLNQAVSVVKHNNPCGLAVSNNQTHSLEKAWMGDPVSAFGSIICFTDELQKESAEFLKDKFVEIIMAPKFSEASLEVLKDKKNLRLMEVAKRNFSEKEYTYRSICGGLLISEEDQKIDNEFMPKTKNEIPKNFSELRAFSVVCGKYLKSNGVCLVQKTNNDGLWMVAAGMGQPNRLEALERLVAPRFSDKDSLKMEDSLLYSDAFFPFKDSIEVANKLGIKNIIQPGGSIRDEEVISACDEYGIAMEFTGTRHFRH